MTISIPSVTTTYHKCISRAHKTRYVQHVITSPVFFICLRHARRLAIPWEWYQLITLLFPQFIWIHNVPLNWARPAPIAVCGRWGWLQREVWWVMHGGRLARGRRGCWWLYGRWVLCTASEEGRLIGWRSALQNCLYIWWGWLEVRKGNQQMVHICKLREMNSWWCTWSIMYIVSLAKLTK